MLVRRLYGAALALLLLTMPAHAAVMIAFYAHKLGNKGFWVEFPHAYIALNGRADAGGPVIKGNYGFTPPVVGPAILLGRVNGAVIGADDAYVAKDTPAFSLPLTDKQYVAVIEVIKRWQNAPQPSYDLETHNCVTFVKEIAAAIGLNTTEDNTFVRDPAGFLADLKTRNIQTLARWAARAVP
jgi:hypothetical protein